ncbi:M16 family metallopeptidase [Terrilactibacillus laevilacticus]|uniref:M16 family metallopeptidase n=1 Tax=Terrilactibacillus laevilacticus TaxID=1380157 RepID=A0ABW5PPQ2_9BACI|nr:pitrilysin family protein [Terrilactibacillus laevilacticus]
MITKHVCSNGVRIILETLPTVRSVTIGFWVATGSRYENEKNNGISHFIEHMLFKGTVNRTAREIAESFDRIGGQVNAFTSKEYTCYYARVLDEHAEYAVNILSDMLFHSKLDDEDINKEKQVIGEEIKMYDDTPDDLVHDLLSEASFGKHPLGFPILGTEQTIQSFTQQDLKDHMTAFYTPDNIVVSIAGNVDEKIIPIVERIFETTPKRIHRQKIQKPTFRPDHLLRKKETEQAHVCLGYEGIANNHETLFPLIVMNNILGGSMSSRLFQEIREDRGLAYSTFSFHTSYKDSGILTLYGGTGRDQMDELCDALLKTVEKIADQGVTQNELENSKEQLKGNMMLSLESTSSRMSRNAKNELTLGRQREMDEMIEKINSVTLNDVSSIAKTIFNQPFSYSIVSPAEDIPKAFQPINPISK